MYFSTPLPDPLRNDEVGSVLLLLRKFFEALLTSWTSRLVCLDEVEEPDEEADPRFSINLGLIKFPPSRPPAPVNGMIIYMYTQSQECHVHVHVE